MVYGYTLRIDNFRFGQYAVTLFILLNTQNGNNSWVLLFIRKLLKQNKNKDGPESDDQL